LNILLGGSYLFSHCTFANYWNKDKARDKPAVNINNYSDSQTLPISLIFANSIIDGKLENELSIDIKKFNSDKDSLIDYTFSNNWMKTNINTSDANIFINNRKGDKNAVLEYKDIAAYNFQPVATETRVTAFTGTLASQYANIFPPPVKDIKGDLRNTTSVTAGAYEKP